MSRRQSAGSATAAAMFQTAVGFHEQGELQRAEHLYREVLRQQPQHADALNMLGVIGCQCGNPQAGAGVIRQALALAPEHPDYNNNLGLALLECADVAGARAAFERAVKHRPRFAEAQCNLANLLRTEGDIDGAIVHYRKALKARADYPDALNNLGNLLRQRGNAREAAQLLQKLLRLQSAAPGTRFNLALALRDLGDYDAAATLLRDNISANPEDAGALEQLGHIQRHSGAPEAAVASYEQALVLQRRQGAPAVGLLNVLALVHYAQNRLDAAAALLQEAVALAPDSAVTHNHLGMVAAARGEQAAASHFNAAISHDPTLGSAWFNLAEMGPAAAERSALLARIEATCADLDDDAATVELDFARGRLYDAAGRYDEAFAAFARANATRRRQIKFDGNAQERFIDALIGVFDRTRMAGGEQAGNPSERPLFIVGLPRSGTSLVEQIVASHPAVHGAGELTFFPQHAPALDRRLGSSQPFPGCVRGHEHELGELAQAYLDVLQIRAGEGALRVSDKMPYNFLYLGLIALLFPRARVLHCVREPMATCFSIFSHDLAGNHPYSYDLAELAQACRGYARLMQHWREHLPLAMLDVSYEKLTTDVAAGAREMIGFLGLDWDPACLDFHRNERAVTTASQWQVRRPVYTTSRDHWRHYTQHLGALQNGLEAVG